MVLNESKRLNMRSAMFLIKKESSVQLPPKLHGQLSPIYIHGNGARPIRLPTPGMRAWQGSSEATI
jgi:hypothetical protein